MQALPFLAAVLAAAVIAPAALRLLADGGHVRENYRGAPLPFPAGWVVPAAAAVALIPLAALHELADADVLRPELGLVALYVLGAGLLGLVDDVFSGPSRGWRGHAGALREGAFTTGALKAAGALGLAMLALAGQGLGAGEYLLAVAVVVLATNLFNLFDLRPGRAAKAFVALAAGLMLGTWSLDAAAALGLFAGPVLVLAVYDLRERAMLGDAGSNVVGALAGLWLVLALDTTGQAIALVLLVLLTAYCEFRSLTALIERVPALRRLDTLGRPHD